MKKYVIILFILMTVIIITSCAPTTQKVAEPTKITPPPLKVKEIILPPPQITEKESTSSAPPPPDSKNVPEAKKSTSSSNETKEKVITTNKSLSTFIETFDHSTIFDTKYNKKIIGSGSINQDNQLVMNGSSDYGIIWNTFYTQKEYNFLDNFNISADINLSGHVSMGNIKAVIGLENMDLLTSNKNQERGYCELNIGAGDRIIRMSKTIRHLDETIPNAGVLTLTYSKKFEKLTCTFNGEIITQYQHGYSGAHYGFLRAGLNDISTGGIESSSIGSFTAIFDNWYIKQES